MLVAKTSCGNAEELLCHDNFETTNGNNGGELVSVPVKANVPVIIIVDGYAQDDDGDFELSIDLSTGDSCNDAVPVLLEGVARARLLGTTTGLASNANASAPCTSANANGLDVVYEVKAPVMVDCQATLTADFSPVLYARSNCNSGNNQVACDNPLNGDAQIDFVASQSPRYVWVDADNNASGGYQLTLNPN